MTPRRPAIMMRTHLGRLDAAEETARVEEMLLGIEEEQVPCEVSEASTPDPLQLAHDAALASPLGVGIGVALGYVVVTTETLPKEQPYIARRLEPGRSRTAGTNAARLVKRVPMRTCCDERNPTCKH